MRALVQIIRVYNYYIMYHNIVVNPRSVVRMQTHAGGAHVLGLLLLLRRPGDDLGDPGGDDQCGQR